MKEVLFVTWDGPDSPYLESLFLPVFRELAQHGFRFHVLQFTWGSTGYVRRQQRAAAAAGVGYASCPVLRGPPRPSAVAMISVGAIVVSKCARRCRADIVMPRSILPAAMVLLARRNAAWAIAFDADGLAADERVEFADWSSSGSTYRIWREVEAQAVRVANAVVTRTNAAKPILLARAGPEVPAEKIFVIPNARDPHLFSPGSAEERARTRDDWRVPATAPCVVFAGSVGPQYHPDEMLFFLTRLLAHRRDAHAVLLSHNADELRESIRRSAVSQDRVVLRALLPLDVARQLAAADLGLALRSQTFSQRAVSPIKVAEYLLCGVPVLTTPIGDVTAQVEEGSGLIIDDPREVQLDRAVSWFFESVLPHREAFRKKSREVGLRHFALETAVRRYVDALTYCSTARGDSHAP